MLLKDLNTRYDFDDESRWSAESRQLMICAVAMDPRFKLFASKLCTSVRGESAQEQMVWATVKDMAIQHWKFEEEEQSESQADGAIMSPPHKLARTGMGSLMSLYMDAAGEGGSIDAAVRVPSIKRRKDKLDAAIEQYKMIPCVGEDTDPLLFWKGWDHPGSALQPLLPLAAFVSSL